MPTHSEAVRLNLEYYRKQAKARLKASRQADPGSPIKLADAQFAIARENGFASWTRFRDFIVRSKLDVHGLVSEFVKASISAPGRAEEILREQPEIASAGLYPALVLAMRRASSSYSPKLRISRRRKAARAAGSHCYMSASLGLAINRGWHKRASCCCGTAPIPTRHSLPSPGRTARCPASTAQPALQITPSLRSLCSRRAPTRTTGSRCTIPRSTTT